MVKTQKTAEREEKRQSNTSFEYTTLDYGNINIISDEEDEK